MAPRPELAPKPRVAGPKGPEAGIAATATLTKEAPVVGKAKTGAEQGTGIIKLDVIGTGRPRGRELVVGAFIPDVSQADGSTGGSTTEKNQGNGTINLDVFKLDSTRVTQPESRLTSNYTNFARKCC